MGYVLGLDLGPTSIGWAAIQASPDGNPVGFARLKDRQSPGSAEHKELPAIGARIFSAGVDNLNQGQREEPKNKKRREKRSVRRRLHRARSRRKELLDLLVRCRFIASEGDLAHLLERDPYELRAKAVTDRVELPELARVLLHMAKRRGFQSNRRVPEKDKRASEMKQAKDRLAQALQGKTLGQFWREQQLENRLVPIRNRQDQYKWIAQRDQYRDELSRIWERQASFYPGILTEDLRNEVAEKILFKQFKFELSNRKKRKVIGTCGLIPGKPRWPWSDRLAQRFRIFQKVNDIQVMVGGVNRPLTQQERSILFSDLDVHKERGFDHIRKLLWPDQPESVKINIEYKENVKLKGNEIDALLAGKSFFGRKAWSCLTEEQKEDVWKCLKSVLADNKTPVQAEADIRQRHRLEFKKTNWAEILEEPKGNCSYSQAALERLVPLMEQGKDLYTAIQEAGFVKGHREQALLPVPDRANGFNIPNPVVQTVLYQLRKVINLLVKELGLPDRIVIEMARELKANKERRQEILKKQTGNEREKIDCERRIREMNGWSEEVTVSSTDILKYRLWEQQNQYCPYSCRKIGQEVLFTREVEIDHIMPYSMSLDNTQDNLVVCFASENQTKGQNTPVSWLGKNSLRWQQLEVALARNTFGFTPEKLERFSVENEQIAERYQPERLLRDTSYITREVRDYLKRLYSAVEADQKVATSKGPITAELRKLWGLNAILREGEIGPKKRDDLRHHAVDAAVVAITEQRVIHRITRSLQDNWPRRSRDAQVSEPWDGFGRQLAEAIADVNVSHRVERKVRGALHEETNYWKETNGEHAGSFITRRLLSALDLKSAETICDGRIRQLALERLQQHDGDPKKAFQEPLCLPNKAHHDQPVPIYTVRVWKTSKTMIQVRQTAWAKPGDNHHVEVFKRNSRSGQDEYVCKVWTTWDVAQRIKNEQPVILGKHPKYEDAEFVMSLAKKESIWIKDDQGRPTKAFVKKISGEPGNAKKIDIEVMPLHIGDTSKWNKTEKNKLRSEWRITSLNDFAMRAVQKITVDPLGRVRRAND